MHKVYSGLWFVAGLIISTCIIGQEEPIVLIADRIFDGEDIREGWMVVVQNGMIIEAGPEDSITPPLESRNLIFEDQTLMPGMIEGHAHILLHPYNETPWNDQVLKESYAERTLRAANHLRATLEAGVTTVRDLGSEGAGYLDVGIKKSIQKGIIPGPDLIVAGPAIVATGSYGPKGFADHVTVPLGAEVADGYDDLIKTVRRQIGNGADFIKVYADYRWGPDGEARPTFSISELEIIVETAKSSGRQVAAHASTEEGMFRAALVGVYTIEHGDSGTERVFEVMKQNGVALCPTIAAGDAIMQYRSWRKGSEPEPERIQLKRTSFQKALDSGIGIVAGGDVGVFPHGENVRELELMVAYGMPTADVIRSVTSGNADLLQLKNVGRIQKGYQADIIATKGNPLTNISELRNVTFVMNNGNIVKEDF